MKKKFNLILLVTLIVTLISSCTVEKRRYMSGYHIEKNSNLKTAQKSSKETKNEQTVEIIKQDETNTFSTEKDGTLIYKDNTSASTDIDANEVVKLSNTTAKESKKSEIVKEIAIIKSLFLNTRNTVESPLNAPKVHWGAIAGLVTGIVSIFIAGIPLGACAIIFSAIALKKIRESPELYKGKGMAIAGLICGIIGVVGALIYISTL